jgi:hypothetical protein
MIVSDLSDFGKDECTGLLVSGGIGSATSGITNVYKLSKLRNLGGSRTIVGYEISCHEDGNSSSVSLE